MIEEAVRALPNYDILQPYMSYDKFRSLNVRADNTGCNLYVFVIGYQQNFTTSQPIKKELLFDGVVPIDINRYALVLPNNLVPKSSDGQRHFDIIQI